MHRKGLSVRNQGPRTPKHVESFWRCKFERTDAKQELQAPCSAVHVVTCKRRESEPFKTQAILKYASRCTRL